MNQPWFGTINLLPKLIFHKLNYHIINFEENNTSSIFWKIRLKTFLDPRYVWYHSDTDSKFLTAREISMPVNSANCADMLFMICFIFYFLFYLIMVRASCQALISNEAPQALTSAPLVLETVHKYYLQG